MFKNKKQNLLDELRLDPKLISAFSVFFSLGFVAGLIYSFIKGSLWGIILDAVLLVLLIFASLFSLLKKRNLLLPLGVACLGTAAIFLVDLFTAQILQEENLLHKIPLDTIILFIINIPLALIISPLFALIFGIGLTALFVVLCLLSANAFLTAYLVFMVPSFLGITIFMFVFIKVFTRLLVKHYGDIHQFDELNLNDLKVSKAEFRCIHLLLEGLSTKEIAKQEKCSESAIQARLGSLYVKLKVPDRSMLMYKLGRHRLVWKEQ